MTGNFTVISFACTLHSRSQQNPRLRDSSSRRTSRDTPFRVRGLFTHWRASKCSPLPSTGSTTAKRGSPLPGLTCAQTQLARWSYTVLPIQRIAKRTDSREHNHSFTRSLPHSLTLFRPDGDDVDAASCTSARSLASPRKQKKLLCTFLALLATPGSAADVAVGLSLSRVLTCGLLSPMLLYQLVSSLSL